MTAFKKFLCGAFLQIVIFKIIDGQTHKNRFLAKKRVFGKIISVKISYSKL